MVVFRCDKVGTKNSEGHVTGLLFFDDIYRRIAQIMSDFSLRILACQLSELIIFALIFIFNFSRVLATLQI